MILTQAKLVGNRLPWQRGVILHTTQMQSRKITPAMHFNFTIDICRECRAVAAAREQKEASAALGHFKVIFATYFKSTWKKQRIMYVHVPLSL
jgi:biotin synthase-related radical SAM superfamily protein